MASSTATHNTARTIRFRENVLSGTNSIRKDTLFRENVLGGTNCESYTARDALAVSRETASDRNGVCRFHSPSGDVTQWQRGTKPRGPERLSRTSLAGAKKRDREHSSISKNRASEGTRTHTHEGTRS